MSELEHRSLPDSHIVAITTTDSEEAAEALADGLVKDRLAACVQISSPIKSVYRWEGEVQRDTEWQLWIKTTSDRLDEVTQWLDEHHTYDVPELVALSVVGGNPAYLKWLTDYVSTRPWRWTNGRLCEAERTWVETPAAGRSNPWPPRCERAGAAVSGHSRPGSGRGW
jgi:periplasmic divalent cation tolerance protein